MYNNPTCVQSITTATTSASTTLPDYTAYYLYSINPMNDYDGMNSYYGGRHPNQSTTYRNNLQVDNSPTFYRRSRIIPTQAVQPKIYEMICSKGNRGYASYCGPWKDDRRWPMCRKNKEPYARVRTYQELEFGSSPIDQQSLYYHGLHRMQLNKQPPALRRTQPYYAPSYTTYPPSIMNAVKAKEEHDKRYSIMMKVTVKAIELLLGVATIGFIIGPKYEMSFYSFLKMAKTGWQGLVIAISMSFSSLSIIMLFGIYFAYRYILWRRFDFLISLLGSFGYLFVGAIEACYAACYPFSSEKTGLVCYRLEWIIATVLIFVNVIIYIMDCVLSFRTEISIL